MSIGTREEDEALHEMAELRRRQVASVMPLIGPLLDAWDGMPNDLKYDLEDGAPDLVRIMRSINAVMND